MAWKEFRRLVLDTINAAPDILVEEADGRLFLSKHSLNPTDRPIYIVDDAQRWMNYEGSMDQPDDFLGTSTVQDAVHLLSEVHLTETVTAVVTYGYDYIVPGSGGFFGITHPGPPFHGSDGSSEKFPER